VVLVKSAEPGETLAAGSTVVTLGDTGRPWLRGYINETQLGQVKLTSGPGDLDPTRKDLLGRISFVASEAEFTPKQIQTLEGVETGVPPQWISRIRTGAEAHMADA
jgi:HlyD family secretion protein